MDDFEIVRRAMQSSLITSAPEKLAALDRIEARLKAAEQTCRTAQAEIDAARAIAEQLAEALRCCQELPNSPGPWQAARTALATYDAYAQKGKT